MIAHIPALIVVIPLIELIATQQKVVDANPRKEQDTEGISETENADRQNVIRVFQPENQRIEYKSRGKYYTGLEAATGTEVAVKLHVKGV